MKRLLVVVLFCSAAFAQTVPTTFEMADIHASVPVTNPTMRGGAARGGRYEVRTATMVDLITMAYETETNKVLGGPNWLDWNRYDVLAKMPQGAAQKDVSALLQN